MIAIRRSEGSSNIQPPRALARLTQLRYFTKIACMWQLGRIRNTAKELEFFRALMPLRPETLPKPAKSGATIKSTGAFRRFQLIRRQDCCLWEISRDLFIVWMPRPGRFI